MQEDSPPIEPTVKKFTARPLRRTVKLVDSGFVPPTKADAAQERLKAVPQTFDGQLVSTAAPIVKPRTLTIRRRPIIPSPSSFISSSISSSLDSSLSSSNESSNLSSIESSNDSSISSSNDSYDYRPRRTKLPVPEELEDFKEQEAAEEGRDPYVLKEETLTAFASPTRKGFGRYILNTFAPFTLPPKFGEQDVDACKKMAAAGESDRVETFLYQQFVREYLRAQTPYRGLLVYHGLGSGKTCSAIAAAEALFGTANKKIIVMTPFSLRGNFQSQISFCGFRHYRLNNYWVFLDLDDKAVDLYAKKILHIPEKFMDAIYRRPEDRQGVWVPDFDKPSNYKELSSQQQSDIREQLTAIIENRIRFINYNGVTPNELKRIACDEPELFDDAVIIIDEIHNITRLMQGNLEKYMRPRKSRKAGIAQIPPEPVTVDRWKPFLCGTSLNYNRAYLLYRLLVGARNSKIIGLSGTPLINFPDELGILMNIVAGYINTCKVSISTVNDAEINAIKQLCAAHPRIDMVRTKIGQARTELFFSIFQEGYIKNADNTGLVADEEAQQSIKDVWADLVAQSPILAAVSTPIYTAFPRFPVEEEIFQNHFLNRSTLNVKNDNIILKRMHGLVSYYKGSSEDLMPKIVEDTVVRVPFSPYSLGVYITKRKEEIEIEKEQEKKEKKRGKQEAPGAFDDVKKVASTANYRFNSRAACNFCFPSTINRPSLRDNRKALTELEDTKTSDVAPITDAEYSLEDAAADAQLAAVVEAEEAEIEAAEEEVIQVGSGSSNESSEYNSSEYESSEEEFNSNLNSSLESSEEYDEDELAAMPEDIAALVRSQKKAASVVSSNADSNASSVVSSIIDSNNESSGDSNASSIVSSIDSNNESSGDSNASSLVSSVDYTEEEIAEMPEDIAALIRTRKEEKIEEEKAAQLTKEIATGRKLSITKKSIKPNAPQPTGRIMTYEEELAYALKTIRMNAKELLQLDGPADSNLEKFSPKYAEVLRRVNSIPGSSLLYSQFKTVEGLGIFGYALEANGWARIEIRGTNFTPETIESLKKGPNGQNRFLFFTGEGTLEERKILLNIFNARINELPPPMQSVLKKAGFEQGVGNLAGQLCKLIGITGAGAEGISLKAVRAVHILEPYWNNVRTDQVKGRAVRICSHADLPPEERTVSVFTYCTVFDPADIKERRVDETILLRDNAITSDERVFNISNKKAKINEDFLRILKQSAVDCVLNSGENEAIACYQGVQGSSTEPAFDPDLDVDMSKSALEEAAGAVGIAAGEYMTTRPMQATIMPTMTKAPVGPVTVAATAALPATVKAAVPAAAQTIKRPVTSIAGKNYWMDRKKGVQNEIYILYELLDRTGKTPLGEVEKNPITGKFRVKLF